MILGKPCVAFCLETDRQTLPSVVDEIVSQFGRLCPAWTCHSRDLECFLACCLDVVKLMGMQIMSDTLGHCSV